MVLAVVTVVTSLQAVGNILLKCQIGNEQGDQTIICMHTLFGRCLLTGSATK
jgi:hypothetical protein